MSDYSKPKQFDFEAFHAAVMESQSRLATAIGKFSIEFVVVERQANWAISVLLQLKTNKISDLLFAAIRNLSTRLDILESLIAGMAMDDSIRTELKECVISIRGLNVYRTWLLHDAWSGYVPPTDEWQKIRPRTDKKLHYQSESFSALTINARTEECRKVIARLSKAMKAYYKNRSRRATSPETP